MTEQKILILEDDAIISMRLQESLDSHGYHTRVVTSGEKALIEANRWKPDLLLADILLSGELYDGIEIAGQIREQMDLPVVYLTAYSDPHLVERAMRCGAYGYLVKPVQDRDLQAAVDLAFYKHRMDHQLEESERFNKAIMEAIPGTVYIYDLVERRVTFVTPNVVNIFGYTAEEILNKRDFIFEYLLQPRDHPEFLQWIEAFRSVQDREVFSVEAKVRAKNGNWCYVLSRNSVFKRDLDGRVLQTIGTVYDITPRKAAEQALEASEARYRSLVDGLPIGIYRSTPEGQILDVNPALVRMLGYPNRESLLSQLAHQGYYYPDDRKRWAALIERENAIQDFETCWKTFTGEPIWVNENARIVRDEAGKPLYYEGAVIDISRRKRAERALLENETRYRWVSELVSDFAFSCLVEPDGTIVREWVTEGFEQLTGYAGERRIPPQPDSYLDLIHPDDQQAFDQLLGDLLVNREPVSTSFRLVTRWNDICYIELKMRPIWDDDQQRVVRIVGAGQNQTERKRMEGELLERARQQATIAELGQRALAVGNLQDLLAEAAQQIAQRLQSEIAAILEISPSEEALLLRAGVGWMEGFIGKAKFSLDAQQAASLPLTSKQPLIVTGKEQDPESIWPQAFLDHRVVSGVSLRIGSPGEPFGVLVICSREPREFKMDEVHFLQAVANTLAAAIQRRKVEDDLKSRNQELERFERVTIGRELKMIELKKRLQKLEKELKSLQKFGKEPN